MRKDPSPPASITLRSCWRAALVAGILGAALVLAISPASSFAQETPTRASFSWTTEPRFGLDADGDGLIEIENTAEYAHNRLADTCPSTCPDVRLNVELAARPTFKEIGLPSSGFVTYEWRISGPSGAGRYLRIGNELDLFLPEGEHNIDLRVRVRLPWGSVTLRRRGSIVIDDLLIVAVGDSYPSGEGSPDVARDGGAAHWADASDPKVLESHALAHRSTVGWPARVALAIEDGSRQTSVTFVDLAASGARIDRGLLRPRSEPAVPAQFDDIERIAQGREIDILLIQIGGNDVGFSRIIRALVQADPLLNPVCYEVLVDNVWASAQDGVWDRGTRVTYDAPFDFGCATVAGTRRVTSGFDGIAAAFDRLADRLEAFDVGRVILVAYPNPTGGSPDGGQCDEIVGDVTAPFGFHEVDEQEQTAAVERLLDPLNRSMESAAQRHGWIWVGGVSEEFTKGHGYCAPWPDYGYPDDFASSPLLFENRIDFPGGWYRPPGRYGGPSLLNDTPASWYRTAGQSAALQGPSPRFLTSGTLHPNELGHAAIARLVLTALLED